MARLVNLLLVSALVVYTQATVLNSDDDIKSRLSTLEDSLKQIQNYVTSEGKQRHDERLKALEDAVRRLIHVTASLDKGHHHCCHSRSHQAHLRTNGSIHDMEQSNPSHGVGYEHGKKTGYESTIWTQMRDFLPTGANHGDHHQRHHEMYAHNDTEEHHQKYHTPEGQAHHKVRPHGHGHSEHHGPSVQNFKEHVDSYITAECNMRPATEYRNYTMISRINGKVYLREPKAGGQIEIMAILKGFPLELGSLHGFHIHRWANVGESCANTGGHYNPYNVKHGAPHASVRHIGDFGNIERNANGEVYVRFQDHVATLSPGVESIVGRTLVVHEGRDDLGAKPGNGNAGKLIACCVIVKT